VEGRGKAREGRKKSILTKLPGIEIGNLHLKLQIKN
jgi:hypothetical protein